MSAPKFNQNQNAWEIDVPGDNSCLFWAVALAYLIPVKDNHDDFQERFKRLFGKKSLGELEHVKNWMKAYNPFPVAETTTYQDKTLNELVKTKFRRRVINYIEDHESQFKGHIEDNFADYLNSMRNSNSWGGEPEIRAMSDLLDWRIQVISAGQEHSYGDGRLIQLFHVGSLPDSPAANHYHFGLEKSLGDAYQSVIKPVISPRQEGIQIKSQNVSVHSGDKPININVAAFSGIRHNVHANMIKITGIEVTQKILPQHIKGVLQTLEKTTNGATNVSAVDGIGNTIYANKIKVTGQQVILPSPPAEHLPQKWQVPPQNLDFTGRENLLKQIADHFSKKNVHVVLTTTHGLGGIGKTQLAIEFVWQHFQQYKGVVWFNAENRNHLLDDYISLGIELNILHQDDKAGSEERALLVKHWLEDPKLVGDWLLIYDNAPKYGGNDQEGIGDLFPTRGGKILITSRHTQWPQASIQVYVFTSEESRAYIQKVLDNKALDSNQVDALATTLGYLPLALAQACAYIKKNRFKITRYLELYEKGKKELLSDKTLANQILPPDSNRAIVYITWDITMEAVRKESLLADKWLSLCAYLSSHDIPNFLLEAFACSAKNNPDSEIFETALGTLGSYSMLTINEESASTSIHRLVQEVMQLKSGGEERIRNLLTVRELFKECFPNIGQSSEDYTKRRQLVPHMEAFLPQFETLFEKSFTNEDKKQKMEKALASFLSWMAQGYRDQGNWQKERALLERILLFKELHYGHNHQSTLTTRTDIAEVLLNQGKYKKALQTNKEVYEKIKEVLGPAHPNTLTIRANMALVLYHQGKYEEALRAYKEIYEKLKEVLGPAHPDTLMARDNMSSVLLHQGKYEEALEAYKEVYEKRKEVLGAAHPDTLTTCNNMSSVLLNQGKYEEALEAYKEVYEKRKELLGAAHPDALITRNNMVVALIDQGKYEEALEAYKEIYEKSKEVLGPGHPSTLTTLNNMALVLEKQGKYEEAFETYKEVYEKRKEVLGAAHPDTLTVLHDMSLVLNKQKKYEEALEAFKEVYEKRKELLGATHPDTLTTLNNMAVVLNKQRKYEEALEAFKEVYEKRKELLGARHSDTLTTLNNMAVVLLYQGKNKEAFEAFKEVYATRKELLGAADPSTLTTRINMTGLLFSQGKYEEALKVVQEIYDTSKRVLGTAHSVTKNALKKLVKLQAKTASQASYGVDDQLFAAAKNGDVQWVRDCIRKIANVNARDNNNWTPLHYAAENGHIEVVDILLQNHASINTENNGKATPLHFAVRNGHITVVEELLSSGAMVNATTQCNWTSLHFAAKQGHIEVVKALLKYGADVTVKNKASKMALNLAAENNHLGLAVVLLNHDYINATDLNEQQRDELTSYIFEHHPDLAELLITKLFSTLQIQSSKQQQKA